MELVPKLLQLEGAEELSHQLLTVVDQQLSETCFTNIAYSDKPAMSLFGEELEGFVEASKLNVN